jgi:hypothetical protein
MLTHYTGETEPFHRAGPASKSIAEATGKQLSRPYWVAVHELFIRQNRYNKARAVPMLHCEQTVRWHDG